MIKGCHDPLVSFTRIVVILVSAVSVFNVTVPAILSMCRSVQFGTKMLDTEPLFTHGQWYMQQQVLITNSY